MTPVVEGLITAWFCVAVFSGLGVGLFLDALITEPTVPARFCAGVFAFVFAPLVAAFVLARGGLDLYRAFFPPKAELPEARLRR